MNAIRICHNNPKIRVWFGTSFTPYPRSVFYSLISIVGFSTLSVIVNLHNSLTPWAGMVVLGGGGVGGAWIKEKGLYVLSLRV